MYVHMYSLICSGISMAFVLIVFTEPDGMNAYLHIHMLMYTHAHAYTCLYIHVLIHTYIRVYVSRYR